MRQVLLVTTVALNMARAIKKKWMDISLMWVTIRAEGRLRALI
jgi:hypothetical protein